MARTIPCPQCEQPVNPQTRYCPSCGADLPYAALAAEHAMGVPIYLPQGFPITPEILVPRLGDYLIEKGVLTREDLERGLEHQKAREKEQKPILIGQALRELGLIDAETLEQAITVQILQLQVALNQTNRQLEQRVNERTLELQQAVNKLTELSKLKANFIANTSHELRTPLTHMKGYLDLLADGGLGTLSAQQTDALAVMQRAEARLERLIEDLIQFALATRGELRLIQAETNFVHLVQLAVQRSAAKAKANSITLKVKLPQNPAMVFCDAEKVLWVLDHLLDNAIKFTSPGGRVGVEVTCDTRKVKVAVIDTGIGIPADRLEEIFEPFHQLDGSSTRRFAGTGLGLALTSRILDAHGTRAHVQSTLGKGSRFEFCLPLIENGKDKA